MLNLDNYEERSFHEAIVTQYSYFRAQRVAMRREGVVYFLVGDHPSASLRTGLGMTNLVLDASGNKVAESRHYPYGGQRWTNATLPTDYRFTGARQDAYIKLYQMGARWYDSELGRWISPDTIIPDPANPQSLNRFAYVRGNPLKFVDPTGHMEDGECGLNGEQCSGEPPDIEEIVVEILQGMVDSIFDPARTDPIVISLDDGTNLVIMPVGSDPFQDRSGFEWLGGASEVIGTLGAVNDAIEGLSLLVGGPFGPSDFFAGTDTIVAMAGSACSGDMWFGKPHPDLPAMWLGGQDVLWTAGVDGVGPHFVGALGAMFTGSPEGYVAGKWGGDLATTALSIGYDVGRVQGDIPTVINAGWSWSSGGGLQGYVLVYPEHLLSP